MLHDDFLWIVINNKQARKNEMFCIANENKYHGFYI